MEAEVEASVSLERDSDQHNAREQVIPEDRNADSGIPKVQIIQD